MDHGSEGLFMICLFLLFFILVGNLCAMTPCSILHFSTEFSEEEIRQLKSADSLERTKILVGMQQEFENAGFVGAEVYEKCKGDTLFLIKKRGEAFVYGEVRNKYPLKTKPHIFAKLSGIESGEKVALADLTRASKKLERTGYFIQTRNAELYREKGRNRLVPLFYMEESSNSFVEGLLTYSSEDNSWIGVLDVSLKNILGTARNLEVQGVSGDASHQISFNYLEPWLFSSAWNGKLRGFIEDDSLYNDALLEIGVSRMIAFEWEFSLFGGAGNDEWTSALEISYQTMNSFNLPTQGTSLNGKIFWKNYRKKKKEDYVLLEGNFEKLLPIYGSWILRFGFAGGTLLPTSTSFLPEDLIGLGGVNSWKGFRKDFLKTRAYGNTELALRFQGLWNTAFEVFYQPGIYRGVTPRHGWIEEHQYGLGIIQYRSSVAISLYYAMRPSLRFEEGFLHLGVKALF